MNNRNWNQSNSTKFYAWGLQNSFWTLEMGLGVWTRWVDENFYGLIGAKIKKILRLPYKSLKKKFFTQDLSTQDLNAECKIFKKMFHEEISFKHETQKSIVDLVIATVLMMPHRLVVTVGYTSALCKCVFASLSLSLCFSQ